MMDTDGVRQHTFTMLVIEFGINVSNFRLVRGFVMQDSVCACDVTTYDGQKGVEFIFFVFSHLIFVLCVCVTRLMNY